MGASSVDRNQPQMSSTFASQSLFNDDVQIVQGLIQARPEAALALYDRCHQVVERSVLRVLRSKDSDFDDLVQLAFERVLRSIHQGQYKGTFSLARWASSIATHAAIDVLRARLRERKWTDKEMNTGNVVPLFALNLEYQIEARSEVARIHRVLDKMPAKQVEAFMLHDVYGHDLEEVAAVLGVSVAAAQSRTLRGRRELYRRLGIACEGEAK